MKDYNLPEGTFGITEEELEAMGPNIESEDRQKVYQLLKKNEGRWFNAKALVSILGDQSLTYYRDLLSYLRKDGIVEVSEIKRGYYKIKQKKIIKE